MSEITENILSDLGDLRKHKTCRYGRIGSAKWSILTGQVTFILSIVHQSLAKFLYIWVAYDLTIWERSRIQKKQGTQNFWARSASILHDIGFFLTLSGPGLGQIAPWGAKSFGTPPPHHCGWGGGMSVWKYPPLEREVCRPSARIFFLINISQNEL